MQFDLGESEMVVMVAVVVELMMLPVMNVVYAVKE